ncbi:MAG: alkaline phosphatase family protein [Thermoanaerobaculaceae bacterium]|nr:alkaline phosphatase family protein [Thermoanaerobaculaceae bacterium]MDI9622422.1 alkaline phosphatase family protein [Acidobacteriota bacterium]NLH11177.1 phosphoglycerate mutase (2,3-diphosphoglycerate-independent) [Holophagae bacterium]
MVIDSCMSEAVRAAYGRGQDEERMEPLVRVAGDGHAVGRIEPGDSVIFYDLRGEREVELTAALVDPTFAPFPVERLDLRFVTMIEYDAKLPVRVGFPPLEHLRGTLAEVVSRSGLGQSRVAESEKAIHVSYFFAGKRQEAFPRERRIVLDSPAEPLVSPAMRAAEVADAVEAELADPAQALIVANLANIDVVGHSECRDAIEQAVMAVDTAVGRMVRAARRCGVAAVVTADHGTVERWLFPEGTVDTGHTDSPVPCLVVPPPGAVSCRLRDGGSLSDVAPTILDLLGLDKPAEMTGRSLLACGSLPRCGRVLLVICDGWGVAAPGPGNLIAATPTPAMDELQGAFPHTLLAAAGEAVGLPPGTVGNSEAGHLHLGAGRVVPADRVRIAEAIEDGSFFTNEAFRWAAEAARDTRRPLHLLGIVSFFSSHGSLDHLFALLELARRVGVPEVFVHGLLGRRGERPQSGADYVALVEKRVAELGLGRLVSVIGRYWALDREQHWDRVRRAYDLLVHGIGRPVGAA